MTLKQFLKPDKRKILVFTILLFFVFCYFISNAFVATSCKLIPKCDDKVRLPWMSCSPYRCRSEITWKHYLYGIIHYLIFPSFFWGDFYGVFDIFLTSLIYYWVLSCLIVWIYDKFRKK